MQEQAEQENYSKNWQENFEAEVNKSCIPGRSYSRKPGCIPACLWPHLIPQSWNQNWFGYGKDRLPPTILKPPG